MKENNFALGATFEIWFPLCSFINPWGREPLWGRYQYSRTTSERTWLVWDLSCDDTGILILTPGFLIFSKKWKFLVFLIFSKKVENIFQKVNIIFGNFSKSEMKNQISNIFQKVKMFWIFSKKWKLFFDIFQKSHFLYFPKSDFLIFSKKVKHIFFVFFKKTFFTFWKIFI